MRDVAVVTCVLAGGAALSACVGAVEVLAVQAEVPVRVEILPGAAALATGASHPFACSVTGSADRTCTWSVLEGASGGTVTGAGVYTAPPAAGTYHVVVASRADPSKSASATVTVTGGSARVTGPCDIYEADGAPCVAAHSTVRALYGS